MPIFKNPIAYRLARWITVATRPHHIRFQTDDQLLDDLAAGADEIERLTEALRHSEHSLANIIRTG